MILSKSLLLMASHNCIDYQIVNSRYCVTILPDYLLYLKIVNCEIFSHIIFFIHRLIIIKKYDIICSSYRWTKKAHANGDYHDYYNYTNTIILIRIYPTDR